jgi:hypothetical protein
MKFGDHSFNFVNAAAGGWGTADYVAYVEEFGKHLYPDIIIVFLNTDDIGRSLKSPLYSFKDRHSLLLKRNRAEPDILKKLTEFIPFYNWCLENLHSLQLLRKAYLMLGSGQGPTESDEVQSQLDVVPHSGPSDAIQTGKAVDLAKALFLRLKRWADENGSELYVTTTGWHRPPYDKGPPEPTRAFMTLAERFFEQAGIPYSDVSHEVLRARMQAPETFTIPNDRHPNERGSELIAQSVWPFIMEKLYEFCARRPEQAGADPPWASALPLRTASPSSRGPVACKIGAPARQPAAPWGDSDRDEKVLSEERDYPPMLSSSSRAD